MTFRIRTLYMCSLCAAGLLRLPSLAAEPEQSDQQVIAASHGSDQKAVQNCRDGLARTVQFAASRPDLFPAKRQSQLRMLTREQKDEVRGTWRAFLDYSVALDSIRRSHAKYYLITDKTERNRSFLIAYQAFLAQYRFSLELIRILETDPGMDVLLDDPVSELGLTAGTYTRFKFLFLNAARAAEFAALKTVWTLTLGKPPTTGTSVDEDSAALLKLGCKEGSLLTVENALELVRKGGSTAWFPIQKGVSIWMGDTRVWRKDLYLITQEQIADLAGRLQPGDILLERREWYMTNIGLPGFWPHAAIFVGTPENREGFFNDPEVKSWVASQGRVDGYFEKLLESRYPAAYAQSLQTLEDGHRPRVLEAIGEGVIFTTLEHSAAADSLCVLRPRLTRKEIAVALFRSFFYVGRPYDFNFDFATDSSIVCTELVCKSYEKCPDSRGLKFPMLNILGRLAAPANELVRQFDSTYGTPDQQYDLVAFLDGAEAQRKAVERDVGEFRKSWRRPKWHVVIQEPEAGKPVSINAEAQAVTGSVAWAQAMTLEGLPNLHKVTPSLYRGAQPLDPGFAQLKNLGIKTVINLRAFHSDREMTGKTGLKCEDISFKTWHPEDEDVIRFLQIAGNAENAPVFVHCQHGADRTGTMCAIYRMVICGWDKDTAIREMTDGGFGFHPVWKNLVSYLQDLDVDGIRQKAFPRVLADPGD
jgi:protein tyrosine phosphatase (PTP) superfamily phosphohydrolase (DUF442 family)